jgi:hypothetical protein
VPLPSLFTFRVDLGRNLDPYLGLAPCPDLYLDLGPYLFPCFYLHLIQVGKIQNQGQIEELLLRELWLP